jgi:uncharacterized protein (TIGR02118 family)
MIKIIGFMKKKEGFTIEEFSRYWYEEHAPLGFRIVPSDIRFTRYVHHYTVPMEGLGDPMFDGVAEFCFEDMDMFQKWFAWFMSDGGQPLRDDEGNFIDSGSVMVAVVEERVIIPGDEARGDGIKLIAGVRRKSGLTLEEFKQYWYEKHVPLALKVLPGTPYVKRYVHNYGLVLEGLGEPALDGIGELFFDDLEAFQKSTEWFLGDGGKPLRDDEENFVDHSSRVAVIVQQRTLIP